MLGPSGSGKTTTLRVIAGFEQPDEGHVELAGVDVTRVPPSERDVNTVFQDYALFPHMTVQENVEYGLRVKGVSRRDRRVEGAGGARARAAAERRLAPAGAALGRAAPARRARARDRQLAVGAAARRAARRARPQAPPGDAGLPQGAAARSRHHVRLRDARPGGGAHDERPPRRVQRRADRADRHARRRVRASADGVRRRLRRRVERVRARRAAHHDPPGEDPHERRRAGRASPGVVREVVYVGSVTRYLVDLDAGGELVVVRQNLEASSQDVLEARGKRVRLEWKPEHTYALPKEGEQ